MTFVHQKLLVVVFLITFKPCDILKPQLMLSAKSCKSNAGNFCMKHAAWVTLKYNFACLDPQQNPY